MTDLFIPYELALKLKKLGFKELQFNDSNVLITPSWDQAFDWFCSLNINENIWPIEAWIQPYLSGLPRQYEAFYWQRGITVLVGKFNNKQEAKLELLKKICNVYEEMLRNIKV